MANERSYTEKVIKCMAWMQIRLIRMPDTYIATDSGNVSQERPCDFFGHYLGANALGRAVYVESKMGMKFNPKDFRQSQIRHLTQSEKDGCVCLAVYIDEVWGFLRVYPWNQGRGQEIPIKSIPLDTEV